LLYIGGTIVLWYGWWFLASDKSRPRHLVLAVVLSAVWLSGFILYTYREVPKRLMHALFPILWVMACVILATFILTSKPYSGELYAQQNVAKNIKHFYSDKPLYNFGWWQNPDIQFLTGLHSLPVASSTEGYALLGNLHKSLAPDEYELDKSLCEQTIRLGGGYLACKLEHPQI
jgi:hypothetical protein